MLRAIFVGLCAIFFTVSPALAAQMLCSGPGLSLDVDVNARSGTCSVDGRRVTLRKAHNPVVCHISNPQLRILTIRPDGSFVYEDTNSDRIVRGNCN